MSRPSLQERFFSDRETLARELADELETTLTDAVARNGRATLAVSGGSTPLPLFRELQRRPLPWAQITVTLVDERWVDSRHSDSNAAFLERELLQGAASAATFVDLYNGATTPEEGRAATEAALSDLPWPLDVVILGMGGDGHTASLFPATDDNREALAAGLDLDTDALCVAIRPGLAPHPRISLTLAAILNTDRLFLHITGDEKKRVYEEALQPGSPEELPIRSVLHQNRHPLEVFWAP